MKTGIKSFETVVSKETHKWAHQQWQFQETVQNMCTSDVANMIKYCDHIFVEMISHYDTHLCDILSDNDWNNILNLENNDLEERIILVWFLN